MTKENIIEVQDLDLFYVDFQALKKINLSIRRNAVTALIGPSGCGKSTFLKTLNRMNDLVDGVRIEGEVKINGHDIYAKGYDIINLRKRVGMVFQAPNPFPMSIYDNVAYGPRAHGIKKRSHQDELVEVRQQREAIGEETEGGG